MRKTNLLTRSGTYAIIIVALGVSAPIFTATAASPVTEAVDSFTQKAVESIEDITSMPETKTLKHAEAKLVPRAQTAAKTEKRRGLKPMRLRLTPLFTPEQIAKTETYRQAIIGGDKTARKNLESYSVNLNTKNRMQLTIGDDGSAILNISKGSGGWPGYPKTNTDWEKRSLSAEMASALRNTIQRCSNENSPVYFQTDVNGGDADLGKGTYEIECVPGPEQVQDNTQEIDLAKAYLASNDLPLSKRQGNFQWKMPFAMFETYVRTTPNATIAGDRAECVRIYTLMKEQYAFTERHRKIADHHLESCATKDYNWVRKREKMAEVQ